MPAMPTDSISPPTHEPLGAAPDANGDYLLAAEGIGVSYGVVRVLEDANLHVEPGTVHALIGPNGAGKSTLANVLTGHVEPTEGTVRLAGEDLTGAPWRRARRGVGRKFQVPRIFGRLTGGEHRRVAHSGAADGPWIEALDEVDDTPAQELSHGWRQRVELGMVLARQPSLTVLDEPAAGMSHEERKALVELLTTHRDGRTYVVVEHDMDFVEAVADRVSFLHEGRVLMTGTFAEVSSDPTVRSVYLGEVPEGLDAAVVPITTPAAPGGSPAIEVEGLTVFRGTLPAVRDVSFSVAPGEALGILGRNGAGKTSLISGVLGTLPGEGRVTVDGVDRSDTHAWERARTGMAVVPQGRGLLPSLTVAQNLRLAELEPAGQGPVFDIDEMFPAIRGLVDRRAGFLSGGEQQQVAVARALLRRPTVLLLDEPTEGLAPAVVLEMVRVLRTLVNAGLTLVLAEQNQHVLAALCSRFLVLRGGTVADTGVADSPTIEMSYAKW